MINVDGKAKCLVFILFFWEKVAIFALGEPIEFALLVESKKPPVQSKGNPMRGRLSKQIVFIALRI
jgi:hypothetical protein